MTTATSWERRFAEELREWLAPVVDASGQPEQVLALLHATGWHLDTLAPGNQQAITAEFGNVATACRDLFDVLVSPPAKLETFLLEIGQKVAATVQAIMRLADALPAGMPTTSSELPGDLLNWLTIHWLHHRYPLIYIGLRLIGVIRIAPQAEESFNSAVFRTKNAVPRLDQEAFVRLLREPNLVLKEAFWGTDVTDADGALAIAIELWTLAEAVGLTSFAAINNPNESFDPDEPVVVIDPDTVRLSKVVPLTEETSSEFGVTIKAIPPTAGGPGALLTPFGELTSDFDLDVARLELRATGRVNPIQIDPAGVRQVTAAQSPMALEFSLARGNATSPFVVIGEPGGFQLSIETLAILGGIQLAAGKARAFIGADVRRFRIVLSVTEADGFLSTFLPKDGISAESSVVIEWSSDGGVGFRSGIGLETTLPLNIDLLGIIKIDSVYLALQAKEDSKKKESAIRAVTATTVKVQLGPVSAIVERFGLQAMLTFPEKGGNLGVANLDLGFKPPNGVGLSIKAKVVTGEGYLYFDVEKEQYAGVLQLEIAQKFSLTAVGLLTTKMPDGSKGFSLLVIISVRFEPGIQLGYGFSLTGLGGLLGVNRTVSVEVLRDGLRRGALGSILFPQHIVENATQIVSNLSTIFPPAQDRFLFGPMAIIGWGGSPPILTLELGIILELPEPVRLMILGRVRMVLPNKKDDVKDGDGDKKEKAPKLKLQLDALGVIDFGSGDISLDAVLYDSTIGPFAVTGQMALRANFGAQPMFLLSVGGFHPAFQAPAGFPSVERVTLTLAKKDKDVEVRLQMSAYFALTSNTIQFGSHLDLYAHLGIFEVIGVLGFDALFQFPPLGLMASFEAMVVVKANGQVLMGIHLQVNLTGPSPWHVWGKAQVTFLFIRVTAEFDVQVGQQERPERPPPINVHDLLVVELQNPANWSSQLPAGENPLVTFRSESVASLDVTKPPSHMVLVHSSAELQVNQRLVPLVGAKEPISLFGNTTPEGPTTFELGIQANELGLSSESVSDWFARAQFYDMSDTEKLSSKSFDQMPSGIRFKAPVGYHCGTPVSTPMLAATLPNDKTLSPGGAPLAETKLTAPLPSDAVLRRTAVWGAAGSAPIRHSGSAKYLDPARRQQGISLKPTTYRVVGNQRGAMRPNMGPLGTERSLSVSAAHVLARRAYGKFPSVRWGMVPDLGPEGTEG